MERALNEIFFDGNVKLQVQRAANTISCKGCFYNTLVRRSYVSCKGGTNKEATCIMPRSMCKTCKHGLIDIRTVWECHRNFIVTGGCHSAFRDDGESVMFVEVCD